MSLDYAILGFLNYRPYTGYDLKKIFDSSVRHFWPADQSQIYRTLAHLAERGLAEAEKVPQEDHPDRKVHRITDTGRAELLKWLAGPPLIEGQRSAALIQVFFVGQLSDREILAKFEGYAAYLREILKLYDDIPAQLEVFQKEIPSQREFFFWMLTLENGIRSINANLAWAESVIERVKQGRIPQGALQ
jgi:PadR family transcriptional regulator AphA